MFSTSSYPTRVPERLVAGDRWVWKRSDLSGDYPTATYSLAYYFRLNTTTAFSVTATESGNDYLIEIPSATTAGYAKGLWYWSGFIERTSDSQRAEIEYGTTTVEVDSAVSEDDPRSPDQIILDSIEAVIGNRATIDQQSMSIAGRSLSRMTTDELFKWRNDYRERVRMDLYKQRIRAGKNPGNSIAVKFT